MHATTLNARKLNTMNRQAVTLRMRPTPAVLLACALLVLGGCASPRVPQDRLETPLGNETIKRSHSAVTETLPIRRLADDAANRYLRLDAANTGLTNVADDGQNTFAAFAEAPTSVTVYSPDGKIVRHTRINSIIAVAGVHKGLLFRSPSGASFAAPHPRAPTESLASLTSDPDVIDARSLLEGEAVQRGAYERALSLTQQPARSPPKLNWGLIAVVLASCAIALLAIVGAGTLAVLAALWFKGLVL